MSALGQEATLLCTRTTSGSHPSADVVRDARDVGFGPTKDSCTAVKTHHSTTSSARASSAGGTVRPSALAVLRLIANSYLVGCWTGRLAGMVPLRILST